MHEVYYGPREPLDMMRHGDALKRFLRPFRITFTLGVPGGFLQAFCYQPLPFIPRKGDLIVLTGEFGKNALGAEVVALAWSIEEDLFFLGVMDKAHGLKDGLATMKRLFKTEISFGEPWEPHDAGTSPRFREKLWKAAGKKRPKKRRNK